MSCILRNISLRLFKVTAHENEILLVEIDIMMLETESVQLLKVIKLTQGINFSLPMLSLRLINHE
jgi:hypothetical protein